MQTQRNERNQKKNKKIPKKTIFLTPRQMNALKCCSSPFEKGTPFSRGSCKEICFDLEVRILISKYNMFLFGLFFMSKCKIISSICYMHPLRICNLYE